MKINLDARIVIIGSGPAGLSAAETLKDKGYTNVTILEKASRAGGKCRSINYKGRTYELGAAIFTKDNKTILNLAKKYGAEYVQIDFSREITFIDEKTGKTLSEKNPFAQKLSLIRQLFLRYKNLSKKYQKINEPGLSNVNIDLCMPFSEWAAHHKIPLVAKEFAPFFTGFGYGYFEEIPAAYVLKYYSWKGLMSVIKKSTYRFPDGFQKLCEKIATNHNVLYGITIKNIQRKQSIQIKTKTGNFEFDALIITSPLDESLQYLDANEEEKKLFSKIIYYDYRSYACLVKGFPRQDGYIPGNFNSSRAGHPTSWYHLYKDSNLYIFYVLADWKITDKEVLKNIEAIIHQKGGTMERVHSKEHWKYFPRVTPEEIKNRYFDKLESLQGKNNTYYAGELLNFSTTELSAEYSRKLIEKHF